MESIPVTYMKDPRRSREFLSQDRSCRDPHTNLHDLNGEIWDFGAE